MRPENVLNARLTYRFAGFLYAAKTSWFDRQSPARALGPKSRSFTEQAKLCRQQRNTSNDQMN